MRLFSTLAMVAWMVSGRAGAEAPLKKYDLSPREVQEIRLHHMQLNLTARPEVTRPAPRRPFSEVEEAGYLFFSADTPFQSAEAKRIMARELPAGVTLVVFADVGQNRQDVLDEYKGLLDPSRIKVVELNGTNRGFWARDGLPIPVWSQNNTMELVDAQYYHGFEPDAVMARWFHTSVRKIDYYFEGGNFMVNDEGVCVTVDNDRSQSIPDDIFTDTYGCKKLIRLPYEKGIGHADESVRFINSKIILTDSPTYADRFRSEGLDVRLLPRASEQYETYVNALIVNGTAFVPVYNESNQQRALDVYRKTGLKVVPIETVELSNDGLGSIHCITMTYPKVPFEQMLGLLGVKEVK